MTEDENVELKYYLPICREKSCEGILKIKFDFNKFLIEYECTKNRNHKSKNIFFKTFERFYLKEKKVNNCSECFINLENDCIYKCKNCNKLYCSNCFTLDEHIKKSIKNLSQLSTKCHNHNKELSNYCIDCDKNLCIFCINNTDTHTNHNIKDIVDLMPSRHKINSLNDKIKKKSEYINKLINSIENWQKKFNQKIENLKQNLVNEIILIEKLYLNFNQYFQNYFYYTNFNNFYDDFDNMNNEYLKKFSNSSKFKEQTEILTKFIFSNEKSSELIIKSGYFDKLFEFDVDGKIAKINDKYFFNYSYELKSVEIDRYRKDKEEIYFLEKSKIAFDYKIHSISVSTKSNKIYACLSNVRIVTIFKFDLKKKKMELCKEYIKAISNTGNSSNQFNKCIELINDYVATSDNRGLSIWYCDGNSKYYSRIQTYLIDVVDDLLLINDEYFISSQSNDQTIIFYNLNNDLDKEIILTEIDSIHSPDCLFLFKEYVIVNCSKGIALLSIKTKQLIQYIRNSPGYYNKKICIFDDKYIYIMNYYSKGIKLMKMEFKEGIFIPAEKFKQIELDNKKADCNFNIKKLPGLDILCVNNGDIITWGVNIYVLKEKDECLGEIEKSENFKNIIEKEAEEDKEEDDDKSIDEYSYYYSDRSY